MKRTIEEALQEGESDCLDFKMRNYNLEYREERNELIKDVLAMANTPRDRDSLIIMGVALNSEGSKNFCGIDRHYDDASIQNIFDEKIVSPRPKLNYIPFNFAGVKIGVIEIPVERNGPFMPRIDIINDKQEIDLAAGTIYYRRGSQNARAAGDKHKEICDWFSKRSYQDPPMQNQWNILRETLEIFSHRRAWILMADRIHPEMASNAQTLGLVPWKAVVDFDPLSDKSGLLHTIGSTLEKSRTIHRVVKGDAHQKIQSEPGTHWFFARGLQGRQGTTTDDNFKSWNKVYQHEIGDQLRALVASINPQPVSILMIWNDSRLRKHFRLLAAEATKAFSDLGQFCLVSLDEETFSDTCDDYEIQLVKLSTSALCSGIASYYSELLSNNNRIYSLPAAGGAPKVLEDKDRLWMSEDLDFIFAGQGLDGDDNALEFRRGGEPTWRNLHLHHDCDRDIIQDLKTQIHHDLTRRNIVRINLYHAAGGGGTTVGRRAVWDFRDRFPVAVLKKCGSRDTAERISKAAALTENPILLLVDGGEHSEKDIDELYGALKAMQTATVIVQVLRRPEYKQNTKSRLFWLKSELSDAEADRFREVYTRIAPSKSAELRDLSNRKTDHTRTAFFFGLTCFGRGFVRLEPYVRHRIENLTPDQKEILLFLALAYYYGQQAIPVSAFASLLSFPRSRVVDFRKVFSANHSSALELLTEDCEGEWRPVHQIVSLEILQQLLAPQESIEKESIWKQALSEKAMRFAEFCAGNRQQRSDRLSELVKRVFIYRDNTEILGTERSVQKQFSRLIEDIPLNFGKIEVLRNLAKLFPEDAHFRAHLARMLSLNGHFDEATETIDSAISIQAQDQILHHVRGMVFRYRVKQQQENRNADLNSIVELAKEATRSFEQSRCLEPDIEHGYISEIQMLIDLLDFAARKTGGSVVSLITKGELDSYIRTALEKVEDLLDRVFALHAGEKPSGYAIECKGRIERFYGDYQGALQTFDSLLHKPGHAHPPIRRQIVWTLLKKREDKWENLTTKEVVRISDLLEKNLEEEIRDSTSLRLWLRAIRFARVAPSLDLVTEKVSYWKANTSSLDSAYYLYILHGIRALDGSTQGLADFERAVEECRALSRYRRDRTRSFEWIGPEEGIRALVHQSSLGEWNEESDFWSTPVSLRRLRGRIVSIEAHQKGAIELECGMRVFFVPGRAGIHRGRDENTAVSCYVGFSYDGPRGWDVKTSS